MTSHGDRVHVTPRPRYQASLVGPLGAAPEKKSGMFIEKAGSLSEEVKT